MWDYTEKVMDHFLNPRNVGAIANPDAVGEVGNIVCGDAMKLYLKVDPKTKTIQDAKFQTFGCASAIASASALTELLKGKTLEEASRLTNQDIANFLGELPEEKMHCSVMGSEAFQAAMKNLAKSRPDWNVPVIEVVEEGEDRIVCHCFDVTEAEIRNVIRSNHLTTVEQVTYYTKAGGGCGGCKDEIQLILDDILGKASPKSGADGTTVPLTNLQKIALIQDVFDSIIRDGLKADGGDAELVDIAGDTVMVRLTGKCAGCASALQTLKHWVEAKLREKVSAAINVVEVK
ncbi:MAG: Fe-S cluster assembly protein NifU [Lentisphaerae bacterium]|jgi:NifU-like protein|nr:Fe-S cluster assembly protein NifU [Lentisphaerota bacterium]